MCSCEHVPFMEGNSINFTSHKELNLCGSNSRCPPFYHASLCAKSYDGIAVVLGHCRVHVFGDVIGDDVSSGGVNVLELSMIMHSKEEVVRKIGDALWERKFVKLCASTVIDKSVLLLWEGKHFIIVKKSATMDRLVEVDLHFCFFFSPVEHGDMAFVTGKQKMTAISRILTIVSSHLQGEVKCIGCWLHIDAVGDISLSYLYSLVSIELWLKESWIEVMQEMVKFVSLVGWFLSQFLTVQGLLSLFVFYKGCFWFGFQHYNQSIYIISFERHEASPPVLLMLSRPRTQHMISACLESGMGVQSCLMSIDKESSLILVSFLCFVVTPNSSFELDDPSLGLHFMLVHPNRYRYWLDIFLFPLYGTSDSHSLFSIFLVEALEIPSLLLVSKRIHDRRDTTLLPQLSFLYQI